MLIFERDEMHMIRATNPIKVALLLCLCFMKIYVRLSQKYSQTNIGVEGIYMDLHSMVILIYLFKVTRSFRSPQ